VRLAITGGGEIQEIELKRFLGRRARSRGEGERKGSFNGPCQPLTPEDRTMRYRYGIVKQRNAYGLYGATLKGIARGRSKGLVSENARGEVLIGGDVQQEGL